MAHMCSKREPCHALFPLLCCVVPLNHGNCRLTIPVVTRFSHCYATWCPLTTGIVASQYPSSRAFPIVMPRGAPQPRELSPHNTRRHALFPLLCHVVPLNHGNCRLTIPVVMRFSHCYATWCPLTTGIVASQYPSSRDAVLVRRCLVPLILVYLNTVKATLPQ